MAPQDGSALEVYPEAGLEPVAAGLQTYAAHAQPYYPTHTQSFEPKYQIYQPPLRYPFGLTPLAFGGLVALVTTIIVGATIGGGLGGTLASCRAQQTRSTVSDQLSPSISSDPTLSSTPTPSSPAVKLLSNYSVPEIATVDSIYVNCPDGNEQTYTTRWQEIFTIVCGIDYTEGFAAHNGGIIADIAGIIAYSLDDCIAACSYSNQQSQLLASTPCKGVTWRRDMKNATATYGGNCWLKNATLADGTNGKSNPDCASAYLS